MITLIGLEWASSPFVLGSREGMTIFVSVAIISLTYLIKQVFATKKHEHMSREATPPASSGRDQ